MKSSLEYIINISNIWSWLCKFLANNDQINVNFFLNFWLLFRVSTYGMVRKDSASFDWFTCNSVQVNIIITNNEKSVTDMIKLILIIIIIYFKKSRLFNFCYYRLHTYSTFLYIRLLFLFLIVFTKAIINTCTYICTYTYMYQCAYFCLMVVGVLYLPKKNPQKGGYHIYMCKHSWYMYIYKYKYTYNTYTYIYIYVPRSIYIYI
jgi:hypothetical protein